MVKRMVWAVMAAVMVYDGCLCANELYLKKEMESEATLSTFTRIIDRMENTPGFEPRSTRVAMVGEMIYSPLSEQRPGIANDATGLWFNFSVSYYDSGYKAGEMAYDILVNGADITTMNIEYAPQVTKEYNASIAEQLGVTIPDGYTAIAAE